MEEDLQLALKQVEQKIRSGTLSSEGTGNLSWFNLHHNRYLETLEMLHNELPVGSILLDIGCSPGYLTMATKELGYKVYGIDLDPKQIEDYLASTNIVVKKCDIEKERIPFDDEMFDCVLFTEVLEHLSYCRVSFAFNQIRRVLKKGGLMILSTPNLTALENRILLFFGKEIIRADHNRVYTLKEVERLLQDHGFYIWKIRYSMARDTITHAVPERFVNREHVLVGFIKHPYWKNIGRALAFPLKFVTPSFRSCIFIVSRKSRVGVRKKPSRQ